MMESVPRALLALCAVIALTIVFVVVRDYVRGEKTNLSKNATRATPTESTGVNEKNSSPNTKHARLPKTMGQDISAGSEAAADEVRKQSAVQLNGLIVQSAPHQGTSATEKTHGNQGPGVNSVGPALSVPQCVPLPNVTKPEDADAPYYQNWAREYSCEFELSPGIRLLPPQNAPKAAGHE